MIQKLSKLVLIFGLGLFLAGAVLVTGSGITWGINGVVLTAGIAVVVLAVGGFSLIWIAGAVEGLFIRFALIWQSLRRINAETAKQEMAADYYQVMHPTAGAVAVDRAGNMIRLQPPAGAPGAPGTGSPTKDPEPEPVADGPEIVGPLLPVLEGMSRILLVGGMSAGKTELLRHLAYAKSQQDGHTIICDSHASPTTWPNFVQVAGIGRNYPEIEAVVNHVCNELDSRYKLRASGQQKAFEPLTLIVDELFVLNQFCELKQQFKSLLAESRKVNIGLIVAGQSDRAGALGLSGNYDLVNGFEACCYLERLDNGQRVGFIRAGNRRDGKYYLHPGPYRGGRGGSPGRPGGSSGPGPSSPPWGTREHGEHRYTADRSPENGHVRREKPRTVYHVPMYETGAAGIDAEVVDLYRRGESLNNICKRIIGSAGGKQSKRIKAILATHGLI
jgi:hypothetical protein